MCVQTHRHLSTRKPLLRAFWGQASAVLNFGEPTICRPAQGSGQRAVRRGGDPRIPGGQDRRRTDARSRTSSEDADLLGCSTCRGSGGLGELFGRGDPWAHSVAALGPEPEDHPRGCLRVGSWVTARATEPCPRSQVYLRRHRWMGVRKGWALRIPGKGELGEILPVYSRSPGWYSEAVIRGQAQLLSPHCHHRGALLGKRSRGIECGLRGSAPVPVSLPLPWQEGPGAGLGCESKAQEQPGSHGQKVPLVPTLPISPTCQLPQPHVHILSWAFAVALSMYDHLVGSDTDLSGALCPT